MTRMEMNVSWRGQSSLAGFNREGGVASNRKRLELQKLQKLFSPANLVRISNCSTSQIELSFSISIFVLRSVLFICSDTILFLSLTPTCF